jgi:hypothetical protein
MRSATPARAVAHPALPPRAIHPPPPPGLNRSGRPTRRQVAHIVTDSEDSLLDVLDNLLSKGVVLNADLILALANVDLVYVRLSALLVAADRLLPPDDGR